MKPVLQALVLAERIYEDKSGKKIIAGTFNRVWVGRLPVVTKEMPDGSQHQVIPGGTDFGCPSAYISLTDVVDGTQISLQFVNVSKNQIICQAPVEIKQADRLDTVEIIAPLLPIAQLVKEAGIFSFDVVWNGEILGSHRLRVIDKSENAPGG
jgi:hypothetical protein